MAYKNQKKNKKHSEELRKKRGPSAGKGKKAQRRWERNNKPPTFEELEQRIRRM